MTIPNGFAQVTLGFGGTGAPLGAVSTFGVAVNPGVSVNDVQSALIFPVTNRLMPIVSTEVRLQSILVKMGPDDTGPSHSADYNVAGGRAGAPLPASNSYLVHKLTNLGGRRGRGRMYFPGLVETDVDGAGTITTAWHATAETGFVNFLNDLNAAGLPMVLLHDPSPNSAAPIPTGVTDLSLDSRIATQRRRLRR